MATKEQEQRFLNSLLKLRNLGQGIPPFEEIGVTSAQFSLINLLSQRGPSSVQDIATGLSLTTPTVSEAVQKLEKMKLLKRKNNPEDKRSVIISLTERGQNISYLADQYRKRKASIFLSGLSNDEQNQFLDLLEKALLHTKNEQENK